MTEAPRFSVVIPTLQRADTLVHAMRTVVAVPDQDLELVVQNNGNDPATAAAVAELRDPRVRLYGTDEVLSMTANWEAALGNARGEWILFIGDDDGLVPDACTIAAAVADAEPHTELITWAPFLYLWPNQVDETRRNVLEGTVDYGFTAQIQPSRPLLWQFFAFETHYARLPMIYNSFVRRSVIDRVIDDQGAYFSGSLPDVASGVIDAWYAPSYVRLSRPLSVSGISRHSTGHSLLDNRPRPVSAARDFPALGGESALPGVTTNVEACIAADMLHLQRTVIRHPDMVIDPARLVQSVADHANRHPHRYAETCALVAALSEHLGVDPSAVELPPPADPPDHPPFGPTSLGPQRVLQVVDGDAVGLRTIADAVALAQQLVPRASELTWIPSPEFRADAPVLEGEVSFGTAGVGPAALHSGWSEPEAWGTWSLGERSVLRFAVRESELVRIVLSYRVIPLPGRGRRAFGVGTPGAHCQVEVPPTTDRGELTLNVMPDADGVVELLFTNDPVVSIAELGLGDDPRRIGVGIERASIHALAPT